LLVREFYAALGFQRARQAPVGSMMTLNHPAFITSVTSFVIVAPNSLAFLVAAAMMHAQNISIELHELHRG